MTAGMAKHTMKLVTSIAQTNSGILLSDMPGARCLKIVLMVLTAIASEDSSVKVIICAQKSTRLPDEYCGSGQRHVAEPAGVRPDVQQRMPHTT